MTTLPAPSVKKAPADSIESKVYAMIENYKVYIPIANDRNRLSYCLLKYLNGEGDRPSVTLKTAKIDVKGISKNDLAAKLDEELKKIK
jgi:hypothetical protein